MVNIHKIREEGPAKSLALAVHRGPVWVCCCHDMPIRAGCAKHNIDKQSIGTSDYHTMVLSAAADGSAILSSARMGSNRVRTPMARQYVSATLQTLHRLKTDTPVPAVPEIV